MFVRRRSKRLFALRTRDPNDAGRALLQAPHRRWQNAKNKKAPGSLPVPPCSGPAFHGLLRLRAPSVEARNSDDLGRFRFVALPRLHALSGSRSGTPKGGPSRLPSKTAGLHGSIGPPLAFQDRFRQTPLDVPDPVSHRGLRRHPSVVARAPGDALRFDPAVRAGTVGRLSWVKPMPGLVCRQPVAACGQRG